MNTRTKVILAFIIIFLMGFTSGYFMNQAVPAQDDSNTEQRMQRGEGFQQGDETDRSEYFRRARIRLAENLELTPSQQDEFFDKMRTYHHDIREAIKEHRDDEHEMVKNNYLQFRNEVADFLDSHQLEKLDSHFHPDSVQFNRHRGQRHGRN